MIIPLLCVLALFTDSIRANSLPTTYHIDGSKHLDSLITVSGYIVTSNGVPFVGMKVSYYWDNGIGSAVTETDANGKYSFSSVTPGSVGLQISCNPYVTVQQPLDCKFSSQLNIPSSISNLNFTLPVYTLHSVLIQDKSSNPMAGYNVFTEDSGRALYPEYTTCSSTVLVPGGSESCGTVHFSSVVKTDTAGRATVALFPSTNSTYQAFFKTTNPDGLSGIVAISPPFSVNSPSTNVSITIPDAVAISGAVVTTNGLPVNGLIATWTNPLNGFDYAVTDANGKFSFPKVSAGTMTVNIDNIYDGYQSYVPSCFTLSATFTSDISNSDLVVTLPATTSVTVKVVDENGVPQSGVSIQNSWVDPSSLTVCPTSPTLLNIPSQSGCVTETPAAGGCRSGLTSTDANGLTTMSYFEDLTGTNFAIIQATDSNQRKAWSPKVYFNSTQQSVTITLPPFISVSGYLFSDDHTGPVAASGISIRLGASGQNLLTNTDSTGHYAYNNIVPGLQSLSVTLSNSNNGLMPTGTTFYSQFQLDASTSTLNITLPRFTTHNVHVIDQLGDPVPNAQIFPYNKDYAYYIGLYINHAIVPGGTGGEAWGQIYVGDGGAVSNTDSNGLAQYSMFYIPGTTIKLGCRDPNNSARAASAFLNLGDDSSTNITFVLQSPPSPPQQLTANTNSSSTNSTSTSNSNSSVTIQWQPPATDGGLPLTEYTIVVTPVTNSSVQSSSFRRLVIKAISPVITKSVTPDQNSLIVHSLAPNTAYEVSITASNQIGLSKPASIMLTTPQVSVVSDTPSVIPSLAPTMLPTLKPTVKSTVLPTLTPSTMAPSKSPTKTPSVKPTTVPSVPPSKSTQTPSKMPSKKPSSYVPSKTPTRVPSSAPSKLPTAVPSVQPSKTPSFSPSKLPTAVPSVQPSKTPSFSPSKLPTTVPSVQPSKTPSFLPSKPPTVIPSVQPSKTPSFSPSKPPTAIPSVQPSKTPSFSPSRFPTQTPSLIPSRTPTSTPLLPSKKPSVMPSAPSKQPTVMPSMTPSVKSIVASSLNQNSDNASENTLNTSATLTVVAVMVSLLAILCAITGLYMYYKKRTLPGKKTLDDDATIHQLYMVNRTTDFTVTNPNVMV